MIEEPLGSRTATPQDQLVQEILETPASQLEALLDHPHLDETRLLIMLRRPDIDAMLIRKVSERQHWLGSYLVKAALVSHVHTPKTIGLNLVKFLFWRDLVKVVSNLKLEPGVRRLAEVLLRDRLHEISLGERIALARVAPREAINLLRFDKNEQVVGALLTNSRLIEDDVLAILRHSTTPMPVLSLIANNERWLARTNVCVAVVRNHRVPRSRAVQLIGRLTEADLLGLIGAAHFDHALRAAAARTLMERRELGSPGTKLGRLRDT